MMESCNRTLLPQGDDPSTSSDRVKAPVASGCCTDSGDSKLQEERKSPLLRTPPRARTHSVSGRCDQSLITREHESRAKRKRRGSTPEPEELEHVGKAATCLSIIDSVTEQVAKLEMFLRMAYRPKKEVCDISSILAYEVELMKSINLRDWLKQKMESTESEDLEKLQQENASLRSQLEILKAKCNKQQSKQILDARPRSSQGVGKRSENDEFTEVISKRRREAQKLTSRKDVQTDRKKDKRTKPSANLQPKKRRTRGEALVIKPGPGQTFASVLKEVRSSVNPDALGVKVKSIRQTKAGDVLLEVRAKPEERTSFGTALTGALGDKGGVKHLVPKMQLLVRDLVETTEVIEVQEALEVFLGDKIGSSPKINLTKRSIRGCIQAFVELDASAGAKLERAAKLKVGWVNCRVKALDAETRCYRCQEFGHIARECKGEDKSKNCWKCGEKGHKAAECVNPPQRRPPSTAKRKEGQHTASSSQAI